MSTYGKSSGVPSKSNIARSCAMNGVRTSAPQGCGGGTPLLGQHLIGTHRPHHHKATFQILCMFHLHVITPGGCNRRESTKSGRRAGALLRSSGAAKPGQGLVSGYPLTTVVKLFHRYCGGFDGLDGAPIDRTRSNKLKPCPSFSIPLVILAGQVGGPSLPQ